MERNRLFALGQRAFFMPETAVAKVQRGAHTAQRPVSSK